MARVSATKLETLLHVGKHGISHLLLLVLIHLLINHNVVFHGILLLSLARHIVRVHPAHIQLHLTPCTVVDALFVQQPVPGSVLVGGG